MLKSVPDNDENYAMFRNVFLKKYGVVVKLNE